MPPRQSSESAPRGKRHHKAPSTWTVKKATPEPTPMITRAAVKAASPEASVMSTRLIYERRYTSLNKGVRLLTEADPLMPCPVKETPAFARWLVRYCRRNCNRHGTKTQLAPVAYKILAILDTLPPDFADRFRVRATQPATGRNIILTLVQRPCIDGIVLAMAGTNAPVPCTNCARGLGPFADCRVDSRPNVSACANCRYQKKECSLRNTHGHLFKSEEIDRVGAADDEGEGAEQDEEMADQDGNEADHAGDEKEEAETSCLAPCTQERLVNLRALKERPATRRSASSITRTNKAAQTPVQAPVPNKIIKVAATKTMPARKSTRVSTRGQPSHGQIHVAIHASEVEMGDEAEATEETNEVGEGDIVEENEQVNEAGSVKPSAVDYSVADGPLQNTASPATADAAPSGSYTNNTSGSGNTCTSCSACTHRPAPDLYAFDPTVSDMLTLAGIRPGGNTAKKTINLMNVLFAKIQAQLLAQRTN